jgi:hypothetical protein
MHVTLLCQGSGLRVQGLGYRRWGSTTKDAGRHSLLVEAGIAFSLAVGVLGDIAALRFGVGLWM